MGSRSSKNAGDRQGDKRASAEAASFLKPIINQTRNTAVLDALATMIEQAGLLVGDLIPSETTLAERLQVSRSTIREALRGWESLGIVRRRKGAGTYLVAEVNSHTFNVPFNLQLEGVALLRTTQVRRALEVAVMREAALHATEAQRNLIREKYDLLMQTLDSGRPWRNADAAFHIAIYDASGNPLFGQLIRELDGAFHRIYRVPFGQDDIGMSSFALHGELCDAVLAGDPDRAVHAIEAIIDLVEEEVRQTIK
ncbi:FadR/GntR family transcriptional regulator [Devosia rhodophyticola]|uniref:FadR/GntR family transcriptional regulator n=1 Tax=Devosia rhodophyticola TaxID=3026423 RepID=A0ABY7Z1D9_9HYPH|nr:FadR/GntR family transcriptional regulator [Devosia rhodophyticola]WDR07446.1 FadR/GntR family transcriptional regulator [Devosia rhodophyticola]